jgi:hypothetical protein
LNVYQPRLQIPKGVFHFLREHHGQGAVSSHRMRDITQRFIGEIETYAKQHDVPLIAFQKNQRKEDLAAEYLAEFDGSEGMLFIGKAQEKIRTVRTIGRRNARGETSPWIVETTAMVNQYYFYAVDEDFGPFFLKYRSYFPYGAKLCFNGHEYLKRQLAKERIGYRELPMASSVATIRSGCSSLPSVLRRVGSNSSCGSGSGRCHARFARASRRQATATRPR